MENRTGNWLHTFIH